ncbi:carboxylesterase family protein [Novosphingobium flavum]|uniref:Carboxylesterase family protein n=1 Tax=Novosphingobium flavum TaxID=1778672 RepID=A0A7X1FRC5_9SPHN|nr:carboxylesterase family protein [Novosphingobium flavum]MBC2665538.1 carboxylesterase family protein [Novosphingobium flavum]
MAIALAAAPGLLGATQAAAKMDQPVHLDTGLVAGAPIADSPLTAFWGLPYAEAPTGKLRWRPPVPVKAWKGVRPADYQRPLCPDLPARNGRPEVARSEDCLNVDVVTGADSAAERRPVMVWIHGGTRGMGGSASPNINGAELARKGAVVVTINYRGGPFGLLATPELSRESGRGASGNYGLMDNVLALQWIQRNIAAFGGDPGNVTIIGESFGAATCHFLSLSPLAKGLFHRMITESHSLYPHDPLIMQVAAKYKPLKDAEADGLHFMEVAGAKSAADLRKLPWEKLVEAFEKSGAPEDFIWSYVIDGYVLPRNFSQTYEAGAHPAIPVLTGENRDENRASADTAFDLVAAGKAKRPNPAMYTGFLGVAGYRDYAAKRFGAMAEEYLGLYPGNTDREVFDSANAAIRDNQRISPWTWANLFTAKRSEPVFLYFFTHAPPGPNRGMIGAFHGSEIPYAFNRPGANWTDEDRRIADMMSTYWVNFARTGNPNSPDLPKWAAFDGKTERVMELGDHFQPIPLADNVRLDFWRRFYASQPAR